jgi:hypothetical protein
MRLSGFFVLLLLASTTVGCGDDAQGAALCPAGVIANTMGLACVCNMETGEMGTQSCGMDLTLTECVCSGAMAGTAPGTGGTTPVGGASGGMGMTGGAGGATGGMGMPGGAGGATGGMGMTGGTGGGDGGMPMTDGGGETTLPEDGNQLAVCETGVDCNKGFDCYTAGPGPGHCTAVCANDGECDGIAGAGYTCSFAGLCEVACEGEGDTISCPAHMECTLVGGGGGGAFRCVYPAGGGVEPGTGEPWSICMGDMDCNDGMPCIGDAADGVGTCAEECSMADDCTMPSSGDIAPECVQVGPMQSACRLGCGGGSGSCPDGMECVGFGPGGGFCDYPAM